MAEVNVDILNGEDYTSPEPEVLVPSTQGPQFSDLFGAPSGDVGHLNQREFASSLENGAKLSSTQKQSTIQEENINQSEVFSAVNVKQEMVESQSLNCSSGDVSAVYKDELPTVTDQNTKKENLNDVTLGEVGASQFPDLKDQNTSTDKTDDFDFEEAPIQTIRSDTFQDDEFDFDQQSLEKGNVVIGKVEKETVCQSKESRLSSKDNSITQTETNVSSEVEQQSNEEINEIDVSSSQISYDTTAKSSTDFIQARDEWDTVETITPDVNTGKVTEHKVQTTPAISYTAAYEHLMTEDLTQYKNSIVTTIQRSRFQALLHQFFGPPKLHQDLAEEKDNIFCLAKFAFSNDDPHHFQMLQTIYKKLTGSQFDVQRFGSHWERIGFQGNDPSTDLRSCGMLGLLQILYIVTTPKYVSLARDIYKLSLHEVQNFPFSVMGINVTRICLEALRHDDLNKECNRERKSSSSYGTSVMQVFNQFYAATYFKFYTIWKTQHKTIADTGYVVKDLEVYVKKSPTRAINELNNYLHQHKQNSTVHQQTDDNILVEEAIKFTVFNEK